MKKLFTFLILMLSVSVFAQNEEADEMIAKIDEQIQVAVDGQHYERAAELKKKRDIWVEIKEANEAEDFAEVARLKIKLSDMRSKHEERVAKLQKDRDSLIMAGDYSTAKEVQYLLDALTAGTLDMSDTVQEVDTTQLNTLYLDSMLMPFTSDPRLIFEYQIDIDTVLTATTISYYGLDLTKLIVVNSEKAGEDESLKGAHEKWVDRFESNIMIPEDIKKALNCNFVLHTQEFFQKTLLDSVYTDFIRDFPDSLGIHEIDSMVQGYKPLVAEKAGCAMVIIPEAFNKDKNIVRCNFVFFDIRTHDLLWVTKVDGLPYGAGFYGRWANGIIDAMKYYGKEVHQKR